MGNLQTSLNQNIEDYTSKLIEKERSKHSSINQSGKLAHFILPLTFMFRGLEVRSYSQLAARSWCIIAAIAAISGVIGHF